MTRIRFPSGVLGLQGNAPKNQARAQKVRRCLACSVDSDWTVSSLLDPDWTMSSLLYLSTDHRRVCRSSSAPPPPPHHHHPELHPSPTWTSCRRDLRTLAPDVTLKVSIHPSIRWDESTHARTRACCSSSSSSSLLSQAEAGGPAGGGGEGEAGSGVQGVQGEAAAGREEEESGALPPDPPTAPRGRARGQEGGAGLLCSGGGWSLMHVASHGCHGDGPRELSSGGGQVVRRLKADPGSGSNRFAGGVSAGLHLFPIRTFCPSEAANQHAEAGSPPQQGHHLLLPQQLQRRSQG